MTNAPTPLPRHDAAAGFEPDFVASVIAAASDLALVVDADGRVRSMIVEPEKAAELRLPDWTGRSVPDIVTVESRPKFDAARATVGQGRTPARAIELNHELPGGRELPVRYTVMPYPDEDGALLLLGRDQSAVAETQAQLVQAQMSLEQGYEARREYDARYRLLLRTVQDPVAFVSAADGTISDLNEPAAALLGSTREALVGQVLAHEFADRERAEFMEELGASAASEDGRALTLKVQRTGRSVTLSGQGFRAAGERALICRLGAETASTATPDGLARDLGLLFERSADAIVFATVRGEILSGNDAFLDLMNAAQISDLKGRNIASYLGRGRIDLNVIVENARRAGQMRLYATKLVTELGGALPVEMSVTYLNDRTDPVLALVVRDASRSEAVRGAQPNGTPDSARSVMELVGSATLKEIVAETTDVVEKMCIETAVSLTRNNRVAAAEMLGLSRQSLYVKLRKYDLLHRDGGKSD